MKDKMPPASINSPVDPSLEEHPNMIIVNMVNKKPCCIFSRNITQKKEKKMNEEKQ